MFSSVSDISGFFAPGMYSDAEPLELGESFEILYDNASAVGLELTWDPDTLTLTVNGSCTFDGYLSLMHFPFSDPCLCILDTSVVGSLGTSYFYWQNRQGTSSASGSNLTDCPSFSFITSSPPFFSDLYLALRSRVQVYDHVKIHFTRLEISRFFGDHPGITHSSGSFGEFLCNNFTVSEVNELVARPVLYAVSSLNNGYVSAESQYNIYVICAYFTYVIFVYFVFLIVKLLTFIPCVIIKYVNKATGGDHFG